VTQTAEMAASHYLFAEEHELLRESVGAWARRRIAPNIEAWEDAGEFPRELFEELGSLGFLGAQYPEEYGGQGGDFAANMVVCEEISRIGAESVSMAVSVHTAMAIPPLLRFGTEQQKQAYLPDLLAGRKIAALAITEPEGGSDVAGIRTAARRTADGWVIRGAKTFITNGLRADVILVIARTGEEGGKARFSLFVVEGDTPGLRRGQKLEKIGRHASDTAELFIDDVEVAGDGLLGEEGRGFHQIMWELEAERLVSATTSVALGFHALDLALGYVRERRQFGVPLADFQALRHGLADRTAALTAARELVHTTAWRFQRGQPVAAEISMAKLVAANALHEMADYALQLHGGYGFMKEYPISRVWIEQRVKRLTAGTDEIQREIIANNVIGRTSRRP
jgi:alkylation response protein AidB-like acyl-CoA dehydrogenase